jgi:plastocyanin
VKEFVLKRICTFAAVVATAAVAAGGASASTPTLKGSVTDAFKIFLKQGGKPVKTLKAGKYVIAVSDPSTAHNFHLKGPGVDKKTSVAGKQTVKWTVRLRKGTYTFVCDPHSSFMKGKFTVK